MKPTKILILFSLAICIGFLIAQLCRAESTNKISRTKTAYKEGVAMQELESLFHYLEDTKQTNALHQLNDFLFYNTARQNYDNMNFTLAALQKLREGKTNDVSDFLENQLSFTLSIFSHDYHMLPNSIKGDLSLQPLQRAYDYRKKFPFESSEYLEGVTNAFKILNQTN